MSKLNIKKNVTESSMVMFRLIHRNFPEMRCQIRFTAHAVCLPIGIFLELFLGQSRLFLGKNKSMGIT